MKKAIKKLGEETLGLTKAGVGLGVGAAALGSAGFSTASLSAVSGNIAPIGSLIGAKAVIGSLPRIKKK